MTADGLREYFSKFGDIKECVVMRDPVTKKSRYDEAGGVNDVLPSGFYV